MYSGMSSDLVVPIVVKKMVVKAWLVEGSWCALFLPTQLICFICTCVALPVSFSRFRKLLDY